MIYTGHHCWHGMKWVTVLTVGLPSTVYHRLGATAHNCAI